MTTHAKIPASGYLRKSSQAEDRQAESIAQQREGIRRYADRQGYVIVRWYEDARSGCEVGRRDAFNQMIADAQAPGCPWKIVLCSKTSRFSRGGPDEAGHFRWQLRQAGVEVVYTDEQIPAGMGGEVLLPIQDALNKNYCVSLSSDTLRGQLHRARAGDAFGRCAPFGYDRAVMEGAEVRLVERWGRLGQRTIVFEAPGFLQRLATMDDGAKRAFRRRLVPSSPERVDTVRRAFALARAGTTRTAIVRLLNTEGCPSPRAEGWSVGSLRVLLQNPVYRGVLAWGARTYARFHGVVAGEKVALPPTGRRHVRAPAYQHAVQVADAHEALVSEAEWTTAQAAFKHTGRPAPRGSGQTSRHLLSGLLRCTCGRNLYGTTHDAGRNRYYHCPKLAVLGQQRCGARMAVADRVEQAVLAGAEAYLAEAFGDLLNSQAFAQMVREAARQETSARRPSGRTAVASDYRAQIEKLARRIANNPDVADALMVQLKRLQAEAREAEAHARTPLPRLDAERLARAALEYRTQLAESLRQGPLEVRKAAVRKILREAQVDTHTGDIMLVLEPYAGCQPLAESSSRLLCVSLR